jgi:hypothetical protein
MAINSKKIKLKTVLENNRRWPLIITGAAAEDFNAPIMPAAISPRDLNAGDWIAELVRLAADRLVIDGLEELAPDSQEKFITLLKDRRAGLHKLPEDVQIIIPARSADELSKEIKNLSLIYNV